MAWRTHGGVAAPEVFQLPAPGMPADAMPFIAGELARMQDEYIDASIAYATEDNPGLSVLHFTHHPVGFVEIPIRSSDSHGPIYT
ncbi:MAG: hypothetical protein V7L23_36025 [Nostoc sp.]|uniref:hypothetical protein n=1 Tax=Nostoc sp. TaxID=1180 RepID=UPI002FEE6675